jgi:chitodextrinase
MSFSTGRRRAWIAFGALSGLAAVAAMSPATAAPVAPVAAPAAARVVAAVDPDAVDGVYRDRFLELYAELKDPANGYFSPQGIPYHAVETLIVEAPDYGHETTSEAYSYWIELEAVYGYVTGEWAQLNEAWATMEQYMIPQTEDQPTNAFYNPSSPATYAAEYNHPSSYPSALSSGVSVGRDPIADELSQAYGTDEIYGMHWLADVDNVYGFGAAPGAGCTLGPDYEGTSYINTFQRGPQESVWETVPHPSCEEFEYGGPNGYLDLFTGDSSYAMQWKYTNAPDADARAIQAVYWAQQWAADQGRSAEIADTVAKAAMMGDYLRYALFDKYFKTIGCTSPSCAAGSGKDSAHYLLSWYYAWGGALDANAGWAWRIGSSHAHFGYQNPMAAYALSAVPELQPEGATAVQDWAASFDRQLEFYRWLQSADGGIAGGATNSWDGAYATPPAGTPTFYGMAYVEAPVYRDPPSNQWFGMQVWGMERVAELYYETGDARAEEVLEAWVPWAMANTTFDGPDWRVPATLAWSGAPDTWDPASPGANAGLRVTVRDHGQDVGVAGSLARTLIYWAAAADDEVAQANAKALLDSIWESNRDDKGVSAPEVREDYRRFDDVMTSTSGDGIYIPLGWTGTMPDGDVIEPGVSFLDIRSFYEDDPDWAKVQAYLDGGPAPEFRYHRFWAQAEIAKALADYDRMFSGTDPDDTQAPTAPGTPAVSGITATSATLTWGASTDDVAVTGYVVQSGGGATLATSATTTATLDGLTADTSYTVRVVARDAAGNVSAPSSSVTFRTTGGVIAGACTAALTVVNAWPDGFQAEVKVTAGTAAIGGWTTSFTLPSGTTVANLWSGTMTGTGTITVRNAPWNGSLGAGGSTSYGFVGQGTAPTPGPVTCTSP